MYRYLLLFLILIFLGCQSFEPNNKKPLIIGKNSNKDKRTIIYKSKEYFLSKTPNYNLEQDFQKIVEDSYLSVFEKLNFDVKKSFSYLINPKGAFYPFSRVEVSCLVREDLNETKAYEICGEFFKNIDKKYEILKKEIP